MDDDDEDDHDTALRAYRRWRHHQVLTTPIEYQHTLRLTWADYEADLQKEETDPL